MHNLDPLRKLKIYVRNKRNLNNKIYTTYVVSVIFSLNQYYQYRVLQVPLHYTHWFIVQG